MTSSELIQTKLNNRTNAVTSDKEVKNNRWHYQLFLDEMVGWSWLEREVEKVERELDLPLEAYKVGPANSFCCVEVREINRREGIDDDQNSLDEFA